MDRENFLRACLIRNPQFQEEIARFREEFPPIFKLANPADKNKLERDFALFQGAFPPSNQELHWINETHFSIVPHNFADLINIRLFKALWSVVSKKEKERKILRTVFIDITPTVITTKDEAEEYFKILGKLFQKVDQNREFLAHLKASGIPLTGKPSLPSFANELFQKADEIVKKWNRVVFDPMHLDLFLSPRPDVVSTEKDIEIARHHGADFFIPVYPDMTKEDWALLWERQIGKLQEQTYGKRSSRRRGEKYRDYLRIWDLKNGNENLSYRDIAKRVYRNEPEKKAVAKVKKNFCVVYKNIYGKEYNKEDYNNEREAIKPATGVAQLWEIEATLEALAASVDWNAVNKLSEKLLPPDKISSTDALAHTSPNTSIEDAERIKHKGHRKVKHP